MATSSTKDGHAGEEEQRRQVQECLQRTEQTAAAQQELLEQGLRLTAGALGLQQQSPGGGSPPDSSSDSAAAASGGAGGHGEQRRWWLAARLRLLQHQERLATQLALYNG